jgi:hypothetical protein
MKTQEGIELPRGLILLLAETDSMLAKPPGVGRLFITVAGLPAMGRLDGNGTRGSRTDEVLRACLLGNPLEWKSWTWQWDEISPHRRKRSKPLRS